MRRGRESGQGPGGRRTCRRDGAGSERGASRPGGAGRAGGQPALGSPSEGLRGPVTHAWLGGDGWTPGSLLSPAERASCCGSQERSRGRWKRPLPARFLRCGCCVRKRLWVFSGPCITDGNYRRLFLLVGSSKRKTHCEQGDRLRILSDRDWLLGVWGFTSEKRTGVVLRRDRTLAGRGGPGAFSVLLAAFLCL